MANRLNEKMLYKSQMSLKVITCLNKFKVSIWKRHQFWMWTLSSSSSSSSYEEKLNVSRKFSENFNSSYNFESNYTYLIELTFKASQISFQVTLKKRFLKSLKQKNYQSVNSDLIFVFLEPQIQPFFPRFPIRLKYSSYVEPKFGGYPQAPNAKNKMS